MTDPAPGQDPQVPHDPRYSGNPGYPPGQLYPQVPSYPQAPPYRQAPQYQQTPPYSQAPPYPYWQHVSYPTTNGFAIAALACSFFIIFGAILGIIFGCVALSQIRRQGQRGRGMAIAGIVIGSCWIVLIVAAGISAAQG